MGLQVVVGLLFPLWSQAVVNGAEKAAVQFSGLRAECYFTSADPVSVRYELVARYHKYLCGIHLGFAHRHIYAVVLDQ